MSVLSIKLCHLTTIAKALPMPEPVERSPVEFVELGALSLRDWVGLTAREREPFGPSSAGLTFRPKEHHIGMRHPDGRLVAVVGATVATVEVEGHGPFGVVGVGGLIVRQEMRGHGLSGPLMDRLKPLIDELGPDRAMLFCGPDLVSLYTRRGYRLITAPVHADQPGGRIAVPMAAMWRPLRPVEWPAGVVELAGLPF
jgi:predicted GNAT family N-acyltransferase